MNLISQAKTWLSVKDTNWEKVLYSFMSSLKDIHCLAKGVDAKSAKKEVQSVMDSLYTIINPYYEGKVINALDETKRLLIKNFYISIAKDTPFFRALANETRFLYKKEEMFHIPFNKRYLVGNQRFSISGLPCLYLGGSPYVCWEELGRPDFQKCNHSGYTTSLFVTTSRV